MRVCVLTIRLLSCDCDHNGDAFKIIHVFFVFFTGCYCNVKKYFSHLGGIYIGVWEVSLRKKRAAN